MRNIWKKSINFGIRGGRAVKALSLLIKRSRVRFCLETFGGENEKNIENSLVQLNSVYHETRSLTETFFLHVFRILDVLIFFFLHAKIENNRSHGRIVYTLYWRSALTVFSPSGAYFLIVHVQIKNNRSYGRIVSTLYESACKKLSPKKKGSIKKNKKTNKTKQKAC